MRVEEISLKQLQRMGLNELCALRSFLETPSEESWQEVTMAHLCDERERLVREHIPKSDWPPALQPVDWMITVRESMGLRPMSKEMLEQYVSCQVFVELFTEREILKVKEVPESEWDERLRGEDWKSRLYESYGLEPPITPPPPQNIDKGLVKENAPILGPRTKPKPKRVDNPFKDDSFGTLLK